MRYFVFTVLIFFAFSTAAFGEIYTWTDSDGVLHMVDDISKVPYEYREKTRVTEESDEGIKGYESERDRGGQRGYQSRGSSNTSELYGDQPLDWWVRNIRNKKQVLSDTKEAYGKKKDYVETYESGRRLGAIYSESKTGYYERYKSELASDERRIAELESDLEDFLRKARNAAVPRSIREE